MEKLSALCVCLDGLTSRNEGWSRARFKDKSMYRQNSRSAFLAESIETDPRSSYADKLW